MKIILAPAVTLDGYLANTKGDCYSWINPADEARFDRRLREAGCELVGRKTYEQYQESYDARADVMTYVYTTQTTYSDLPRVKFIHGDIHDVVDRIASEGFTTVVVSGGGELNGTLAEAGLLDEVILSVHPIILGNGIPLFGSHHPRLTLKHISTNEDVPGVAQSRYQVLK